MKTRNSNFDKMTTAEVLELLFDSEDAARDFAASGFSIACVEAEELAHECRAELLLRERGDGLTAPERDAMAEVLGL